jgi:hypothetical protein
VDDDERAETVQQVMRLHFAAWDMESAAKTARAIPLRKYRAVREDLETAFAVTYARTFTSSHGDLSLGHDGLPDDPADRLLHGEIMRLRHRTYAHNDGSDDLRSLVPGTGVEGFTIHGALMVANLNHEWLDEVIPMLERQRDRFRREAEALERRLGGQSE